MRRQPIALGWRTAGERILTAEEMDALRSLERRLRRRALVAGALAPVTFLGWVASIASHETLRGWGAGFLFFVACFGLALLTLFLYLRMRDDSHRAAGLRKAVERGAVVQYAGRIAPGGARSRLEQRLLQEGLLHPGEEQTLEVVPKACVVWRANGIAPRETWFEPEPITLPMAPDATPGEKPPGLVSNALPWILPLAGLGYLANVVARAAIPAGAWPLAWLLGAVVALLLLFFSALLSVALHEGAHVLAGWLVGMRLVRAQAGIWAVERTTAGLKLRWMGLMSFHEGRTTMASRHVKHFRFRDMLMTGAAPLASLLIVMAVSFAGGGIIDHFGLPPAATTLVHFVVAFPAIHLLAAITPTVDRQTGRETDGLRLALMWSNREAVAAASATSVLLSQMLDGARPRDWSADTVEAAAKQNGLTPNAVGGLIRFYHLLDAGQPEAAAAGLEASYRGYDEPSILLEMAFYAGLFDGNAVEARRCFEAAQASRGTPDAKRAEAAVLLAEGDREGARTLALAALDDLKWEPGAGLAAAKKEWLQRILRLSGA